MAIFLRLALTALMCVAIRPDVAAQVTPTSPSKAVSGFSVALVEGFQRAAPPGPTPALPAAWGRALQDIQDVLPYTSYRLVDSQWILSSGRGRVGIRLRSSAGEEYALTMQTTFPHYGVPAAILPNTARSTDARVLVDRFLLTDASAVDLQGAEREVAEARQRLEQGLTTEQHVHRALQRLEAAHRSATAHAGSRALIDTSFVMDPGETVVVGTARTEGGGAIIVLLTAASK